MAKLKIEWLKDPVKYKDILISLGKALELEIKNDEDITKQANNQKSDQVKELLKSVSKKVEDTKCLKLT